VPLVVTGGLAALFMITTLILAIHLGERSEPPVGPTPKEIPDMRLTLSAPELDIMAGEKAVIHVRVQRTDRRPVHLKLEGLPEKIKANVPVIGENQDEAQIELTAEDDIEPGGQTEITVKGSMGKLDDLDRVWLTVKQPGWFTLRAIAPFTLQGTLQQGASRKVKIEADRKWYRGPIEIRVENLPKGLKAETVTIPEDNDSTLMTFSAAPKDVIAAKELLLHASGKGLRKKNLVKELQVDFWWSAEIRKIGIEKPTADYIPPVAFSPNGRFVVSGYPTAKARARLSLWDLKEAKFLSSTNVNSPISRLLFSPDSRHAVAHSGGGQLRSWNLENQKGATEKAKEATEKAIDAARWTPFPSVQVSHLTIHPDRVIYGIGFNNPKDQTPDFYSWNFKDDYDKSVVAFSGFYSSFSDKVSAIKHFRKVTCLVFFPDPDGKKFLSGGEDGDIWVFNGNQREKLAKHGGKVFSLATSADGKRVLSGSADKTLRLWDLSGREIARIDHPAQVLTVGFGPGKNQVVSYCGDGFIRVWQLPP
jgi:WD40 repeat protein